MLNTINILTINCEAVVVLALDNRPKNWPLNYNVKSVGYDVIPKIVSAGAWDVIILQDGEGKYIEIAKIAKAPIVVLTNKTDYDRRSLIYQAGATRCYSMEDIQPCLFILHHIIDNVVREDRKNKRLDYLQSAMFYELRNLISECSNCHRWRHPSTEEYISPLKLLELFQINLTSGICPDCREELYGHLGKGSE